MNTFENREGRERARRAAIKRKKRRRRRAVVGAVCLAVIGAGIALSLWIRPPEITSSGIGYGMPGGGRGSTGGLPEESSPDAIAPEEVNVGGEARSKKAITFAVIGLDDEASLTDTMMVGRFDTENQRLDVVSIPRDTLVNVAWTSKKANTMLSHTGGLDSIEDAGGFLDGLKDLLGFTVDCWVCIDLDAFVKLVDAIGGVYYDVPMDMVYEDYLQDLYIDVKAGYQLLDGQTAMEVVRNRKGYIIPDIGRIETQQGFLSAAADQLFQMKNIFNLDDIIKIFSENVTTDLGLGNLAYLGTEFLKLSSEDITFHTMPYTAPNNYYGEINGVSYLLVDIEPWLELVNGRLNPYYRDVTINDVDIMIWDDDSLTATSTRGARYSGYEIG